MRTARGTEIIPSLVAPDGSTLYWRILGPASRSFDGAWIAWLAKPVPEGGFGLQPEDLIDAVAQRLRDLNEAVYSSETDAAIRHLDSAIAQLDRRRADRIARGVEGTHEP